jgi:hypothetical protein
MIDFYKPNKSCSGHACRFWYSERDGSIFATLIKQSTWDDASKRGTFAANAKDPLKKINIKFTLTEVSGILDCIERNRPFKGYHDFSVVANINFTPWMRNNEAGVSVQNGFSFSVTRSTKEDPTNKMTFVIGFTFAEARLLREFLIFSIHNHFYIKNDHWKNKGSETGVSDTQSEPEAEAPSVTATVDPMSDF